ncbi:KRAB-A domain-containing protein 2-like, partial [Aphis craccivora]
MYELKKKYKNITQSNVKIFLNLCESCVKKQKSEKKINLQYLLCSLHNHLENIAEAQVNNIKFLYDSSQHIKYKQYKYTSFYCSLISYSNSIYFKCYKLLQHKILLANNSNTYFLLRLISTYN